MSYKEEDSTLLDNNDNSKLKEKITPILINNGIAIVSGVLVGVLVYLIYSNLDQYINLKVK